MVSVRTGAAPDGGTGEAGATDWGALYRANASALVALAADLGEQQLRTHVPATPAWTVRDVYAHLTGGPADALAGRMDGAPGPEWTARHVGELVHLPLARLLDQLQDQVDAVVATLVDDPRPGLVWDISVHHADLREALGLPRAEERWWRPVLDAASPPLLEDTQVRVPAYEVFRGLFSRRSRAQMRAWDAPGLDDERLDALCLFGPREDDQPVPA